MRVYIVDTGVQGSHVDFGGRVVNGHTVRAAPVAACTRPPPVPHVRPHQLYLAPKHPHRPTFTPSPPQHQVGRGWWARPRDECKWCQAYKGILPAVAADSTKCSGHGTHVASIVGGLTYGVAKEVTIVPVASCNRIACQHNGKPTGKSDCSSTADVSANLECAPRHLRRPPPPRPPPPLPPPPAPPAPAHPSAAQSVPAP